MCLIIFHVVYNKLFDTNMGVFFWIKESMCRIIPLASRVAVPRGVFILNVDLFFSP